MKQQDTLMQRAMAAYEHQQTTLRDTAAAIKAEQQKVKIDQLLHFIVETGEDEANLERPTTPKIRYGGVTFFIDEGDSENKIWLEYQCSKCHEIHKKGPVTNLADLGKCWESGCTNQL